MDLLNDGHTLIYDYSTWDLAHFVIFFGVLQVAILIISDFVPWIISFIIDETLPVRGPNQHLDVLSTLDWCFIWFNKCVTTMFVYHVVRFTNLHPGVKWERDELTVVNTAVALVMMYLVYDFFYTIFHWALHIPTLYGYVHKHHHRQSAPSRGFLDASNVHPFEFVCGEYDHLVAIWLTTVFLGEIHIASIITFIIFDGFLSPMQHTRYDISIKCYYTLWAARNHDLHHRLPRKNYGQYIMFWDYLLFNSFQVYTPFKGTPIDIRKNNKKV